MLLTQAPGMQQTSLKGRVRSANGAFSSPEKVIAYHNYPPVFPYRGSLKEWGWPPHPRPPLSGRSSLTSSLTFPSISTSSNLLLRGTWGCWVGRRGVRPCTLMGLSSNPHHPPGQPDCSFLGVPPWHPSFQHTSGSIQQSFSCSHSQMVLSLSTSPFSSTTRISSSYTCSNLTQVESLSPHPQQQQAQALPAASGPNSHISGQALCLGGHRLLGETVFKLAVSETASRRAGLLSKEGQHFRCSSGYELFAFNTCAQLPWKQEGLFKLSILHLRSEVCGTCLKILGKTYAPPCSHSHSMSVETLYICFYKELFQVFCHLVALCT